MGKFACCGNASQKVKYEGPDGKTREITVKNLQTLEKYGQGAAARKYTKQLKAEFVKDIASLKRPCFQDGYSRPVDSKDVMIPDQKLKKIIMESEDRGLVWYNSWEDIGESRQYLGQWLKPKKSDDEATRKKKWSGIGTIKYPDGAVYQGQTLNGKFEGFGRMTHANGDIYQGQWSNGMAHGTGTFCDTQGSLYEGHWKEDQQHGKGTEYWDYYKIKYEGDFVEGKKTGQGTFTCEGSTYSGEFIDGMFHGTGQYYFSDTGKIYKGQFEENQPCGMGEMTWPDQSKYIGEFKDGMMHGMGEKRYANGNVHNGEWFEDKAHGAGTLTTANTTVEGSWVHGKLDKGGDKKTIKLPQNERSMMYKDAMRTSMSNKYQALQPLSTWR